MHEDYHRGHLSENPGGSPRKSTGFEWPVIPTMKYGQIGEGAFEALKNINCATNAPLASTDDSITMSGFYVKFYRCFWSATRQLFYSVKVSESTSWQIGPSCGETRGDGETLVLGGDASRAGQAPDKRADGIGRAFQLPSNGSIYFLRRVNERMAHPSPNMVIL